MKLNCKLKPQRYAFTPRMRMHLVNLSSLHFICPAWASTAGLGMWQCLASWLKLWCLVCLLVADEIIGERAVITVIMVLSSVHRMLRVLCQVFMSRFNLIPGSDLFVYEIWICSLSYFLYLFMYVCVYVCCYFLLLFC